MIVKSLSALIIVIVLSGCVSTGNSDKLVSFYVKKDTPVVQFPDDLRVCRESVKTGEFQEEINRAQAAAGSDFLAQSFARGYAEGRLRARLSFLCLEFDGYERLLVPKGTYKRVESLPSEQQVLEVNKLLAEQPRGKSMKEEFFGQSS